MSERYQLSSADGSPDWTPGQPSFGPVWERAEDLLRFHRGQGFVIKEAHGPDGPRRKLAEVPGHLEPRVRTAPPDTVFRVRALKDDWTLLIRRHEIKLSHAEIVAGFVEAQEGDGYVLGAAGPDLWDCSGLSLKAAAEVGVELPHQAHAQYLMLALIRPIQRDQIKPWDLLFHHLEDGRVRHVSWYGGHLPNGMEFVWDAEPHSTGAPGGWPTSTTGTGVQRRPMQSGYYTDWEHVTRIGRLAAVNGTP